MKYIRMPMGMWMLFGKSFEGHLITKFGFDRDTAKSVAVKAKPRYKEIIAGLPTGILIPGTWSFSLIRMAADMKPALPPAESAP